jgi:ribose/xylose/arabinose/galactoside ABC-type transport system permease subunit
VSEKITRFLQKNNHVLMLVLVVIIAVVLTKGIFLRPSNLIVLLAGASVFGLLSFGQGVVVTSGGFDLSVGSLIAVAISIIAGLNQSAGIWVACLCAVLVTTLLGSVNGLIIARTRIPPFIVTLGMMSAAKSLSWMLITSQMIMVPEIQDAIQPLFSRIPMGTNIFPILALIFGTVVTAVLLHKSKWGRYIYAVGGNEKTAIASGVPVALTKVLVYAFSGLLCGLGAIVFLYRNVSASPGTGDEFLLQTFAATMIGGVYMYGGEGSVKGMFIGIITLAIVTNIMTITGIPPVTHKAVIGIIVLSVVLIQRKLRHGYSS